LLPRPCFILPELLLLKCKVGLELILHHKVAHFLTSLAF
jgi:hypothetical protein